MCYIISLIIIGLILVAVVLLARNRMKKGLCVLMYHHVGPVIDPKQEKFFIDTDMFSAHLDLIKEKGFTPVSLSEVEDAFESKQKLPRRAVLITLDDGWADNYTNAYPILKEKKVPATIFLSTAQVGFEKDILDWDQIKEMHASGFVEFSSHGANHKRLRNLSDEEVLSELTDSKALLEEIFEKPVKSFCYPFGAFDSRVRRLVRQAGYTMDYGTRKGLNSWPWKGNRPLLRAHILNNESLKDYHHQLISGYKNSILNLLSR